MSPCNEDYSCDACGHSYKLKKSLWCHKRYECLNVAQFSCPVCSHDTKEKSNLIKRILRVHSEFDIKQRYTREDAYLDHLRLHCLLLECSSCPAKFNSMEELISHIQQVHKKTAENAPLMFID
ncbi:hypothetical protein ILUMI_00700 [Ignelater luminosus]|uniref:C2H2-type domain-containing protein n=1 Tax=Ignelater luminosus TaxID=2038154 RepID=A0A8K0DFT0_IGNLU|nr:hypothetical protein ILUMI_00700 [Ignelater luminosus]